MRLSKNLGEVPEYNDTDNDNTCDIFLDNNSSEVIMNDSKRTTQNNDLSNNNLKETLMDKTTDNNTSNNEEYNDDIKSLDKSRETLFFSKKRTQIIYLATVNIISSIIEIIFVILRNFILTDNFYNISHKTIPSNLTGEIIYYSYMIICSFIVLTNFICFYMLVKDQYKKNDTSKNTKILTQNYIQRISKMDSNISILDKKSKIEDRLNNDSSRFSEEDFKSNTSINLYYNNICDKSYFNDENNDSNIIIFMNDSNKDIINKQNNTNKYSNTKNIYDNINTMEQISEHILSEDDEEKYNERLDRSEGTIEINIEDNIENNNSFEGCIENVL